MKFIENIKEICDKNTKIALFVDMDGVIVEFDYAPKLMKNNVPGKILNARPLNSIIEIFEEIKEIKNLDLYILSACNFIDQAKEKDLWLDKHADFFIKENRIFVIKEKEDYINNNKYDMKAIYMEKLMKKKNYDLVILVDDNHEILKRTDNKLNDKTLVFHVSSLIK